MKMISKCDVSTVPVYFITSEHFYLTALEIEEEAYDHFLHPEGEYFADSGVIAKLDFILLQGDETKPVKSNNANLTFGRWKQYITNSHTYEESLGQLDQFENELEYSTFASYISEQSGSEKAGQSVESLFFLIMNDVGGGLRFGSPHDNGRYTKLCILLDP